METDFTSQSHQEPFKQEPLPKQEPPLKQEPLKEDIQRSSDDKMLAAIAHAGGIFFGFIPSLIIWLMKKDESSFIAAQAKEALNFQISVAIYLIISSILIFVLIGIFLIWIIYLLNVVFCIIAAIKASNGEFYQYPATIRLIK